MKGVISCAIVIFIEKCPRDRIGKKDNRMCTTHGGDAECVPNFDKRTQEINQFGIPLTNIEDEY